MASFKAAFREAEETALEFVVTEHAFYVADRTIGEGGATVNSVFGSVTYAHDDDRYVTLSTVPLRLEIDLNVGRGKGREEWYSIEELHRLEQGGPFPERTHDLDKAMHDSRQLLLEFERLANVLKNCGTRFFAGDERLWEDLRRQRDAWFENKKDLEAHRYAERAFKDKHWQQVVGFLEPGEPRLSDLDRARLGYARKQLRKSARF